jgi:hypothetical protein
MPSIGHSYAWARLTWPQIDALLAAATAIDGTPRALDHYLPDRGRRAAFRAAVALLAGLRSAGEGLE